MSNRTLGPNARRLLAHLAARIAIPPGGGIANAIEAIKNLQEVTNVALFRMDEAIEAIRSAPDNSYGTDEETIAGVILASLEQHQRKG